MNVIPVMPINFRMKTVFRLPLKTGETAKIAITKSEKVGNTGITKIAYEVWKKGKVVEAKDFSDKKGIDSFDLIQIMTDFDNRARQGYDFFREYTKACASNLK